MKTHAYKLGFKAGDWKGFWTGFRFSLYASAILGLVAAISWEAYKQTRKQDEAPHAVITFAPGNTTTFAIPVPPEGSFTMPEERYTKGFSHGVEWMTETLRIIRRNERQIGRSLTDDETDGIIETRMADSRVVAERRKPD